MKKAILIFFLSVLFQPLITKAQNLPELRITQLINFPDTAYEGVAYNNITAVITNISTVPFQGSLSIAYASDSMNNVGLIYFNATGSFIPAGGSSTYLINNFLFSPNYFRTSDNIVVVWPVGNFRTADSLQTQVFFVPLSALGTNELTDQGISIWPNPTIDQIHISKADNIGSERVRILAMNGAVILDQQTDDSTIDLSNLKKGMYIIEIRFKDAVIHRRKFIHSGN